VPHRALWLITEDQLVSGNYYSRLYRQLFQRSCTPSLHGATLWAATTDTKLRFILLSSDAIDLLSNISRTVRKVCATRHHSCVHTTYNVVQAVPLTLLSREAMTAIFGGLICSLAPCSCVHSYQMR
jgi:hypothetical protein